MLFCQFSSINWHCKGGGGKLCVNIAKGRKISSPVQTSFSLPIFWASNDPAAADEK